MRIVRARSRQSAATLAVSAAVASLLLAACSSGKDTAVRLPPAHADFDYQLGGPYSPPKGVAVVTRDHTAPPAKGVYNICYVNAFQAQPDAQKKWDADLLLRDKGGKVVMDKDWGEAVLDIHTDAKRARIARKVNAWIDECAAKGYEAVEPDNYDSYTRVPRGLLTAGDAKAFLSLLSAHAHREGLAVGQKNTSELAPARKAVGADFAVVEECGQYGECGDYTDAFGDDVIVIEYSEQGLKKACEGWGDKISIVRRDRDVVPAGSEGYVRETCGDS